MVWLCSLAEEVVDNVAVLVLTISIEIKFYRFKLPIYVFLFEAIESNFIYENNI